MKEGEGDLHEGSAGNNAEGDFLYRQSGNNRGAPQKP